MNNDGSAGLTLQIIILAERHNTQNTRLMQGQQPANGFRRNGGVVIDKHPGEALAEATAVLVVELRHHGFDRFMQTKYGVAPGHSMVVAFITLHLLQIALRPLEWIVAVPVGKPDVGDGVRR